MVITINHVPIVLSSPKQSYKVEHTYPHFNLKVSTNQGQRVCEDLVGNVGMPAPVPSLESPSVRRIIVIPSVNLRYRASGIRYCFETSGNKGDLATRRDRKVVIEKEKINRGRNSIVPRSFKTYNPGPILDAYLNTRLFRI